LSLIFSGLLLAQNSPSNQGASTAVSGNVAGVRYVTSAWNWSESPSDDLSHPGSHTVHLDSCSAGMDTSNNPAAPYYVYISAKGSGEAVPVTGGTCVPGASGTITVTTFDAHPAGYRVSSATSGIQEAINDKSAPHRAIVLLPTSDTNAPNYFAYSTIFLKSNKTLLQGYGARIQCFTRDRCLNNGDLAGGTGYSNDIEGIEFTPGLNVDGVQIASVSASSGRYTATTTSPHPFINVVTNLSAQCPKFPAVACTGLDTVIFFYSTPAQTQEARVQVLTGENCSPACSSMQFQYILGKATFPSSAGYGWANIENAALEDISNHLMIRDIDITNAGFDFHFSWGMVFGNDQSAKIDGLTNGGSGVIKCTSANFCGALVYARGDQGMAPVLNINHLEASMQCAGNGVRYSSGNTLHVWDSVIQGLSQYGLYYSGGLQSVMIGGVYQESGPSCRNYAYPGGLPSQAGVITNNDLTYVGDDPVGGLFPSFVAQNPGSQQKNYYVVIHSSEAKVLGMFYIGSCKTSGSGTCTTYWPEPNLDHLGTLTYDVLATVGESAIPPNGTGNYLVSSPGISGSCSTTGICSFVDPQTQPGNYTVPTASFTPKLNFWPGAFVLGKAAKLHINDCGQAAPIVTTTYLPSVFCNRAAITGGTSAPMPFWAVAREGDSVGNNNPTVGAILKQSGPATGSPIAGLAGFYGFLNTGGGLAQGDMLTFAYKNPFLTLATPGYRPAASAGDSAIGFDSATGTANSSAQLAVRAPVAISEYIGSILDNGNYKERLTSSLKSFKVPVQIAPKPFASLAACSAGNEGEMAPVTDSSTNTWGATIAGKGSNHVLAYCDGTNWTVMAK
jgi:hypothetical protein